MEGGVEKWWNGAVAAEEDTKLVREPGLWMKSPSAEVDAPAMASIEDRTWQPPPPKTFFLCVTPAGPADPRWSCVPLSPGPACRPCLVLCVAGPARERESEVSTREEKGSE
jgi:hypothetical protein